MALTVKDILEKTFKRTFKGYDENEVDKFLDEIIDELKALQNDNAALKEALDAEAERAKKVKETEETIMHTLVSAQRSAERILNEAARKAEVIIDNAETTAKKRSEQTTKDLGEAQRKLEEVKNSARVFAKSYADMINNEAASFEKIFKSYFGEIEGGLNTRALEKIDEDVTESLKGIAEPEVIEEFKAPVEEYPLDLFKENDDIKPEKIMELTEINKALDEIENSGGDILQETYAEPERGTEIKKDKRQSGAFKPKYDDYSWLYGNDDRDDPSVSFKNPKEKEELESLIDDIIE